MIVPTKDRQQLIRVALEALRVRSDQVIEIRAPYVPQKYGRPSVVAGWFDDAEKAIAAACQLEDEGAEGVYVILNELDDGVLCWGHNRLIRNPRHTAADKHVVRRRWLLIDVDPDRLPDISSTNAELERAKHKALAVVDWLTTRLGTKAEIYAASGNGYHALWSLDLPNNDRSAALVNSLLGDAASKFSDRFVKVDKSVGNAARIVKLYGTLARKGDEVARLGRIHRRSQLLREGFEP